MSVEFNFNWRRSWRLLKCYMQISRNQYSGNMVTFDFRNSRRKVDERMNWSLMFFELFSLNYHFLKKEGSTSWRKKTRLKKEGFTSWRIKTRLGTWSESEKIKEKPVFSNSQVEPPCRYGTESCILIQGKMRSRSTWARITLLKSSIHFTKRKKD